VHLAQQITEIPFPQEFTLGNNYPNPFNPKTTIPIRLPESASISLSIYDIQGRQVDSQRQIEIPAGKHNLQYSALHLPSGIYFYRINAKFEKHEVRSEIKRMILLK